MKTIYYFVILCLVVVMSSCSTTFKTLLLERLPSDQCSVAGVRDIINAYGDRKTKITDIGDRFVKGGGIKTYVHANIREDVEVLLVDDVSETNSKKLLFSLIGHKEPRYFMELSERIADIKNCK